MQRKGNRLIHTAKGRTDLSMRRKRYRLIHAAKGRDAPAFFYDR